MAVVRRFAFNLVRTVRDKRSIKLRRNRAGWDPTYMDTTLEVTPHYPQFVARDLFGWPR
jgi:hypothetical protein